MGVLRTVVSTGVVVALGVVGALASPAWAQPFGPGPVPANSLALGMSPGGPRSGCEVEAEGALDGGRSFRLKAGLKAGEPEGHLRFRDHAATIEFHATVITDLVVDGTIVSVQGHGRTGATGALAFAATLDAGHRTFVIRLSDGYLFSGGFTGYQTEITGSCPFDGAADLGLDGSGAASATIGRAGGSQSAGGVTLTVPQGALSDEVVITMTPILDLGGTPLQGSMIGGVRLEPDGLLFLKPARLTMALPSGVPPLDVVGFGSAHDGSDLHLQPRTVESAAIELELWHFSTAGASAGGAAAASAVQSHQPTTAERRALGRIAVAGPPCEAELALDIVDGPACTHLRQETVRALFDWYVDAVAPGLEQAAGAPSFQVEAAMQEWLQWAERVLEEFFGGSPVCGTLQNECDRAQALATAAVAGLARQRLQACTGTDLPSQIRDIARIADFVNAGAIDLSGEGLPEAANMISACVGMRIEPPTFPLIAARNHANRLDVRAFVSTFTGAQLTDVPLQVSLDVEPGGADASTGSLDGDGRFQTNVYPTGAANVIIDVTVELSPGALPQLPPGSREGFTTTHRLARIVRERVELEALGPVTGLQPGAAVPLRARVAGDGMSNAAVSYTLSGVGQISTTSAATNVQGEAPSFAYTAPAGGLGGSATITASFDGATASITVTLAAATTAVTINPAAAVLSTGGTAQFFAAVSGATNTGVTWTATGGTITPSGLYTAGSTPGTYTVTARSVEVPTALASASVTIQSAPQCPATHYGLTGEVRRVTAYEDFSETATAMVTVCLHRTASPQSAFVASISGSYSNRNGETSCSGEFAMAVPRSGGGEQNTRYEELTFGPTGLIESGKLKAASIKTCTNGLVTHQNTTFSDTGAVHLIESGRTVAIDFAEVDEGYHVTSGVLRPQ